MNETDDKPFVRTRDALQRVATHVLARGQAAGTGRIGLRVTPGGFGTVVYGEELQRLRVSGGVLLREVARKGATSSTAVRIDGSSLADLAEFAGVDLARDFSVGHDTPPLGGIATPLTVDDSAARRLGEWFSLVAEALDRSVAESPTFAAPTLAQLWPEHFDVAFDMAFDPGAPTERRVNLGGSPGDVYHSEPYLYVGPWTADRPGDEAYWNAPFGAVLGCDDVVSTPDPVETAEAFFHRGLEYLTGMNAPR